MNYKPDALWDKCQLLFRANVSEQAYDTWFKPCTFESYDQDSKGLVIKVPSQMYYEYLEQNYIDLLQKVLVRVYGKGINLVYHPVTDSQTGEGPKIMSDDTSARFTQQRQTKATMPPTPLDVVPQQLDPQLNPQQTFENYIEGMSNRLSRQVGLNIAANPNSQQFNPMFVYGPSGCGKTHLINAIGVKTHQMFPQKRVLYISARLFQVQYTNAVRQNTVNDFIVNHFPFTHF